LLSGRSETARALFGAEPAEGGTVNRLLLRGPHDAIDCGMAFLSEDRNGIPELSVRENLTLAALPAPRNGASFPGNDRASSSTVSCSVLASGDRRRAEDPRTRAAISRRSFWRDGCARIRNFFSSTSRPRGIDVGARARSSGSSPKAQGSHDFIGNGRAR